MPEPPQTTASGFFLANSIRSARVWKGLSFKTASPMGVAWNRAMGLSCSVWYPALPRAKGCNTIWGMLIPLMKYPLGFCLMRVAQPMEPPPPGLYWTRTLTPSAGPEGNLIGNRLFGILRLSRGIDSQNSSDTENGND